MPVKNFTGPIALFTTQAVSSTTAFPSQSVPISGEDNVGIIPIVVSGTPSGTFAVQVSNDNVNFQSLTLAAVPTITAGTLSNSPLALNQLPYLWLKVVYTNSAGSGSISATLAAKSV